MLSMAMHALTPAELARLIDHTLLKPDATADQIDRLCDECREYGFFAACVNPLWVSRCAQRLAGSTTRVSPGTNRNAKARLELIPTAPVTPIENRVG